VQALASVACERGKAALDVEVHVLVRKRPIEFAAAHFSENRAHAGFDRGEITLGDHRAGGEHACMRKRAADVVLGQPRVERNRRSIALHPLGHRFGKSSRPSGGSPWLLARVLAHCLECGQNRKTRRGWRRILTFGFNILYVPSIEQNAPSDSLPDFRNLGVAMRILLLGNVAGCAAALIQSRDAMEFAPQFAQLAAVLEPVLLLTLLSLFASSKWLARLPYALGIVAVMLLVAAWTALVLNAGMVPGEAITPFGLARTWILSALLTAFVTAYFFWRRRAFSPALADARLQALQARIRPHFLFNSLNAVLSLIRTDPNRAETALEDLAELYRVLMQDNRRLTTLADELALCRQYLNLEQLRLGERLQVHWDIETMPGDALVPQLLLQPLVENAIFHGIEPGLEQGTVLIRITRDKDQVRFLLANPYHLDHHHRAGNRMALANIRERLALHFDVEARLAAEVKGDKFEIRIVLPYRRQE
jgi:two-component system sensor histidine kinase AlgZ